MHVNSGSEKGEYAIKKNLHKCRVCAFAVFLALSRPFILPLALITVNNLAAFSARNRKTNGLVTAYHDGLRPQPTKNKTPMMIK